MVKARILSWVASLLLLAVIFTGTGCNLTDTNGTVSVQLDTGEPVFFPQTVDAWRTSYGYTPITLHVCSADDGFLYLNDGDNLPTGNPITASNGTQVTCDASNLYQLTLIERVDEQMLDLTRPDPLDVNSYYSG